MDSRRVGYEGKRATSASVRIDRSRQKATWYRRVRLASGNGGRKPRSARSLIMAPWSRIRNVFRGDHLNREIDEELESHIQEAIEQGRDPVEARRAFGSALRHREQSRDVKLVVWLESLRADAIFGWRQLGRTKVTSAAAILSLALAIGACMSAFRLIDALLLRPLPVANPERLYDLSRQGIGPDGKPHTFDEWAYPDFQLMRAAVKNQAELIAVSHAEPVDLTYKSDEEIEKAYLQYVSGWMFSTLGVRPVLGRVFSENDDLRPGGHPYAVISHNYWTHRFGQDRNVIGRTFHMGNELYEIAGVTEAPFTGTEPGTMVDIFVPTMMNPAVTRNDSTWHRTLAIVRTGAAGSAGVGAKRLACFACGCGWRVIRVVVRAVRRQHDQSARQSSAAAVGSGLESPGFWIGARSRCDLVVWVSARPACIVG